MKLLVFFILALFAVAFVHSRSENDPTPEQIQDMLDTIKSRYFNVTDDEAFALLKVWVTHIQDNIAQGKGEEMTLPTPNKMKRACSNQVPPQTDDVRQLHPGHIGIMGAMGDSITAGFGAKDTSIFSLKEYRELSWSIGGKANTLFTLIKFYNPNLSGASDFIGTDIENSLNGANGGVSGAVVQDMEGQATWLINRIKARYPTTWSTEWKLITIWIGGNNLCKYSNCDAKQMVSAADYKTKLRLAITNIANSLPKTFINLVASLDVTELGKYATTMCKIVHNSVCPCATSSTASVIADVRARRLEYNAMLSELAKELNVQFYNANKKDFGAAVQVFLRDTKIPNKELLSAGDCFHPAAVTHGYLATALWNNLITPTPQKKTEWKLSDNETPQCADPDTKLVIDLV